MVDFSDSFKEFLKKYSSSAYAKVTSDDTPPDVLNSIYAEYASTFAIWEKLPPLLRDRYEIVPQDIMDAAARGEIDVLKKMEEDKTLKTTTQARQKIEEDREAKSSGFSIPKDIVVPAAAMAFTAAIAAGYSNQASHDLAIERQFRESLSDKALAQTLSPEEKIAWAESRKRTRDIIAKDWAEHQPEKMLIHIFAKLNRHPEKKEEYLPQIADLIQKIETENRQSELLKVLQHPITQSKMSRFNKEILDLMNSCLLKNVPTGLQNGYLANTVSLKTKLNDLIDADNKGIATDIQQKINDIVKDAKDNSVGLDFKNYSSHSPHPMSAELRQKLMIACCVNDVAYRAPILEKINLSSEYFKSLPADIQTIVTSRELKLSRGKILDETLVADTKALYANMPSIMAEQRSR